MVPGRIWIVKLNFAFLIFIAGIGFLSCKTSKITDIKPIAPIIDTIQSRKQAKVDSVYFNLKKNEIRFTSLQSKFNVDYDDGENHYSIGGQIRILRDSAIWVSLSPGLGFELFRVLITQDSIKMLDKTHSTFLNTKIDYINKMLDTDLDFDMLQALLIGTDFPYYETNVFEVQNLGDEYNMNTVSRRKLKKLVEKSEEYEKVLVQSMHIDKITFKILKQSIKQVKSPDKKVEVEYENYIPVAGELFPYLLTAKLEYIKTIKLKIEYDKVMLNEELAFPFKVPSGYSNLVVPE